MHDSLLKTINKSRSQEWSGTCVIPVLRRLSGRPRVQDRLGYTVRLCLQNPKQIKSKGAEECEYDATSTMAGAGDEALPVSSAVYLTRIYTPPPTVGTGDEALPASSAV